MSVLIPNRIDILCVGRQMLANRPKAAAVDNQTDAFLCLFWWLGGDENGK
jgi:hypothetical protein